ncbi:hypothetical protein [Desulfovibrio sp. ZJ369]|uniref:hypothetical protein n=1 Tax=Desulfovibrio sp. ZJ369 TaxID=2709793 RepID=UPI0013EACBD0|nr:hypothetical protein [Desulfovibrio sp. ZJ369]
MDIDKNTFSISSIRLTAAFMGMASVWLFAPEIVQAAVTFGEIGQNIADNSKGVARGITMAGYTAGVGMAAWGTVDMYKAVKNQGQSTYAGGLTKVIIGALALGLGELLGSGSATLFGSDQTSGMDELGL